MSCLKNLLKNVPPCFNSSRVALSRTSLKKGKGRSLSPVSFLIASLQFAFRKVLPAPLGEKRWLLWCTS